MVEDARERARQLADTLQDRGHAAPAAEVSRAAGAVATVEHVFLRGLRDALQSALTAIEAIDPVSAGAIDELRLEVDKRLGPHA
jgi:hypothetical protein